MVIVQYSLGFTHNSWYSLNDFKVSKEWHAEKIIQDC